MVNYYVGSRSVWDEIAIFFSLLLIYILFAHVVGWSEYSRIALIKSIVGENSFRIDHYINLTGDRSFYNNHYYSDKAPGTSIFGSPIYLILSNLIKKDLNVNSVIFPEKINDPVYVPYLNWNVTTYYYYHEPFREALLEFLLIVALSAVPGALLSLLIYKMIFSVSNDRKISAFVSISFGLGTIIFSYSTVLFGNILSLFAMFLGVYTLHITSVSMYDNTQRANILKSQSLLSGLLIGSSMWIEYTTAPMSIFLLLSIIFSKKSFRIKTNVFAGFVIAVIPLLIYNYSIFGTPFRSTIFFIDPNIYPCKYGLLDICPKTHFQLSKFILYYLSSIFEFLFLPYRGIIFYSPLLILSLLGLSLYSRFSKKGMGRIMTISALLTFSFITAFLVFYPSWFGGAAFGMRYMISIIPFLSYSFYKLISKIWKTKFKAIIVTLLLLSVFHMLLGFSSAWEGAVYKVDENKNGYAYFNWNKKKVDPLDVSKENVLYEYYFKNFIESGLKSPIIDTIFLHHEFNLHNFDFAYSKEIIVGMLPTGILSFTVGFISVIILIPVLCLLSYRFFGKWCILVLLFSLILMLPGFKLKTIVYGSGWYNKEENGTWASQDAVLYIFSDKNTTVFLNITSDTYRYKTVKVFLNGKEIGAYRKPQNILEKVHLIRGINKIVFRTSETCEIPLYSDPPKCLTVMECSKMSVSPDNITIDPRCLSFFLKKISIVDSNKFEDELNKSKVIFGSGWYKEENITINNETTECRWMSSSGDIYIFPSDGERLLYLTAYPSKKVDDVKVFYDGKFLNEFRISRYNISFIVNGSKIYSLITLRANDCYIPAYDDDTDDYRCLSFMLCNISIMDTRYIQRMKNISIMYGSGWYQREKEGRWMSDKSIVYLLTPKIGLYRLSFCVDIFPSRYRRTIQLTFGNVTKSYSLLSGNCVSTILNITDSINMLEFRSLEKCSVPKDINPKSNDDRCISFFFKKLQLTKL